MRIKAAIVLSLFAVNLYAGKPGTEPDQSEPVFVGYSTSTFTTAGYSTVLREGAELCRDTFGEGATIATARHVRKAVDSGTFSSPVSGYAAFMPSDLNVSVDNYYRYYYETNINAVRNTNNPVGMIATVTPDGYGFGLNEQISNDGQWRAACVQ